MKKNKASLFCKVMSVLAISLTHSFAYSQSCPEVTESIKSIQTKQYSLKTKTTDSDGNEIESTLFELEVDYDKTLAQATILKDLNELNESFFRVSREASDINEEGFDDILNSIDELSKSENLEVMQNMATMDALIDQLRSESIISSDDDGDVNDSRSISVDYSSNIPIEVQVANKIERLEQNCGESANALCQSLRSKSSSGKALVEKFILAFSANQENASETTRTANLAAYRAVLRQGISEDADLQALFTSAKELTDTTEADEIISQIRSVGSAEGQDITKIKRAYCCTLTDVKFNQRENCAHDRQFQRSQCSEYTQAAGQSFATVFRAFNNYESRINATLSGAFTIKNLNANPLDTLTPQLQQRIRTSSPLIAQYMSVLSGSIFGGGSSIISEGLNTLAKRSTSIDSTANSMISRINNIYKRGRLTLRDDQPLPTAGLFAPGSISTGNMQEVVGLMNQKTCDLATEIASARSETVSACPVIFGYDPLNPGSNIVVRDIDKLSDIFKSGANRQEANAIQQVWARQLAAVDQELAAKRAKINALKGENEYAHLEQLKRFMIWDLQTRCSESVTTENIVTPQCGDQDGNDSVFYLVEKVGDVTNKLLAEIDPRTIASSNLTDASLQQRRVILGNMSGACQGLTRLNSEQPSQGFSSSAITSACARIASMNTAASETTAFERTQRIERRGYRLDGEGNYRKRKSTGSQLGLGVLRGLGTSAPMLAGTYFQGRQLTDSIPFQEQYIYNQMDQQYAYNWFQQNAQPNYFYPGMQSPYFMPQLGGYSGGYNFNATGL